MLFRSLIIDTTVPAFSSTATAAAIDENSGANQVIYTATATDTSAISYSLKQGNSDDAASFSINSSTGKVSLTDNPDYETKSSYAFTVVASDAAGNSSDKAISLAINDLANRGAGSFAISGTAAVGNDLTVAQTAADPDGNGSVSYKWKTSSDGSNWTEAATGPSFTVPNNAQGKKLQVVPSYTDGEGFSESVEIGRAHV